MTKQIELTNGDLIGLLNAVRGMKNVKQSLPIKVWYGLNITEKSIVEQITHFEEARIQLATQYAKKHEKAGELKLKNGQLVKYSKGDSVKDEQGNFVIEDQKKFHEELNSLLSTKVTVSVHKIDYNDCKDITVSTEENPFLGLFLEYCVEME